LCEVGGRRFVAYSNKTSQIRINEVPAALLEADRTPNR
jgi:hypothetical protein